MATGKRLRYDGIETYLGANFTSGETVITFTKELEADGGIDIDGLNAGEYLSLSILTPNYLLSEIVHLVSYNKAALTGVVERAQEGTQPAKDHVSGQKIVHAATADDFFDVQTHLDDPNAHQAVIGTAVGSAVSTALTAHTAAADPHPQYMLESNVTLTSGGIIPSGATLTVQSGRAIVVSAGGTLTVAGDLIVTGRFFLNGKQIVVSNTEPPNATANVVWIQTVG